MSYRITPAVGGPHHGTWMNAGVSTEPVPAERAVYNLESRVRTVWITDRPNLFQAPADKRVALVGKQSLIDESAATKLKSDGTATTSM